MPPSPAAPGVAVTRADASTGSAEGAGDATEALRRINRALESGPDGPEAIDVVFLDIHMAGLDGLDLARLLTGFARPPLVVFVTAHEGFAVQAFDLKAVDYVLKPVRAERLAMVRDLLQDVSQTVLDEPRRNPWAPEHEETVRSCLHVVLTEEWEHHRYAVRDLDVVAAEVGRSRKDGSRLAPDRYGPDQG